MDKKLILVVSHVVITISLLTGFKVGVANCATTGDESLAMSTEGIKEKPSLLFLSTSWGGKQSPDEEHIKRLEQAGFYTAYADYKNINWQYLSKFNAIVCMAGFSPTSEFENTPEFREMLALFYRFEEEGGGIFILDGGATWGMNLPANEFLQPLGAQILPEIAFENNEKNIYTQKQYFGEKFALTHDVAISPVTKDIKHLWWPAPFPKYSGTFQYAKFTLPLKVGKEWQVVVKGSETTSSFLFPTLKEGDFTKQSPATYSSSPPLMAIREYKKGRIALLDINQSFMALDGHHFVWEDIVMNKGNGAISSDWEKLLIQTYNWLVEPSLKTHNLGGFAPPPKPEVTTPAPINWEKMAFTSPAHSYKGIIGIHSRLSTGKGEVADYVKEAKKGGYNWIIFSEDYEKMDKDKWEFLNSECKKLSGSDFLAIPGIQFKNQVGNNFIAAGWFPFPPKTFWETKRYGAQDEIYRNWHPLVILFDNSANPLKPYYTGEYSALSLFTYKGGKLIDECLNDYLYLQRHTYRLCPLSVHLLYAPEEIQDIPSGSYQTFILANSIAEMPKLITGYDCRFSHPYSVYVSSGPQIHDFQILNNWPNLDVSGGERWRIKIDVSSEVGLKEVRIVDDKELFYRFLPKNEKEYTQIIDGFHDRQKMFILITEDSQNHQAISGVIMPHVPDQWVINCTDNQNLMFGIEDTDKGIPYPGDDKRVKLRPPSGFEQTLPIFMIYPHTAPFVIPEEQICVEEKISAGVFPHREEIYFVSRDAVIIDRLFNDIYPPGTPVGGVKPAGDPKFVLEPITDYEKKARTVHFRSYQTGYNFLLVEEKDKFKKDLTLKKSELINPIYTKGSEAFGTVNASSFAYSKGGSWEIQHVPVESNWPGKDISLAEGEGMLVYPSFTGASGIFVLTGTLGFRIFSQEGKLHNIQLGAYNFKRDVKKGDEIFSSFLDVIGRANEENPLEKFKWIRKSMGIDGTPDYEIKMTQGKIRGTTYLLSLDAENYGVSSAISKTLLPAPLPVVISGLNDNWDAGIWDKDRDVLRRIGVKEGKGYVAVDTSEKENHLYIGNLLVCNNPEVKLLLLEVKKGKGIAFQIHNPFSKKIKVTVQPAKGFNKISPFLWEGELEEGSLYKNLVPTMNP